MKSVEALRKLADGLRGIWIDPNDHSIIVTTCDDMPPSIDFVNLREHVNAILDGIEREVEDMVPLPVDADGEPIHVGDVMEWRYDNGEFEVIGIGGNTIFYIDKDSGECDECPINGGGLVHLMPDTICDTIHCRMRELGVEVDK